MNSRERAFRHITRKKGKTVLLTITFTVVSVLILICISLYTSSRDTAQNIRTAFPSSFTINAKQTSNWITTDDISKVLRNKNIHDEPVLRSYDLLHLRGIDDNRLELSKNQLPIPEELVDQNKTVATSDSTTDTCFTEAGFEITKGKHLSANSNNALLLSETFALNNTLQINDLVQIVNPKNQETLSVRIEGIFKNNIDQKGKDTTPSYDLYQNIIFLDVSSYSSLNFEDDAIHTQYVDFNVIDPEYIDTTLEETNQEVHLPWSDIIVTKHDAPYLHAKESLIQIQRTKLYPV